MLSAFFRTRRLWYLRRLPTRVQSNGTGCQRPERCKRTVAYAVESAQRSLQCVRGCLRNRCMHWYSGPENQAAAIGNLSVRRYGMGVGSRLPSFSAIRQRVCRRISGCELQQKKTLLKYSRKSLKTVTALTLRLTASAAR